MMETHHNNNELYFDNLKSLLKKSPIVFGNVLIDRHLTGFKESIKREGVNYLECIILEDEEGFTIDLYETQTRKIKTIRLNQEGTITSTGQYDEEDLEAILTSFQEVKTSGPTPKTYQKNTPPPKKTNPSPIKKSQV